MMMSLAQLDLNLLKVLDALIAERSVTRAGEVLGRSQPAVSNALNRLRALLKDDLFIRSHNGLLLTPRAEALREPLRTALAMLRTHLFEDASFDPALAVGTCRIATPDRLSISIVPRLFESMSHQAPQLELHIATADRDHAMRLIDADEVDLAIGWLDDLPARMTSERLHDEFLYCVCRRDHPLMARRRKFDIASVLAFPHVVVSASGGRTAIFDDRLAGYELKRKAQVTVSNFTAVPHLLAQSDMIGVFTEFAAAVFETSFGLAIRKVPLEIGPVTTNMVWHKRYDRDPRQIWLRDLVRNTYTSMQG